jgi:autotransporter-associated beta strand protein
VTCPIALRGQVKAFPEAEGFGAYATGARTNLGSASVYHVTNLSDSGSGSFRDAVSQPNRFVVFDLSGVINVTSAVSVSNNVTIAGQTAPGGGITIYGAKVSYSGADNSITRYLRVRKGHSTGRDDALSLADGSNMIFDHLSVTWGNDETFSISPSTGAVTNNITVQNTIIGQGLDNVNHSAGGLMQPNGSISLLRNLFIDNETRNPKAKGNVQYVNNVVYNWTTVAYILGGDSDGDHWANAQGNYFIQGPLNGSAAFTGGNTDYHLYASGNFYDSDRNGFLDGFELVQAQYGTVDWMAGPNPYVPVNVDSAQSAYDRVVAQVGPSLYRDEVDTRMVQELTSLGTLGQIVVQEEDLYPSYPASLPSPPRPTDTDNDGIPNTWESSHGLDPNNSADWKNIGLTGYTRREAYFNVLATAHPARIWTSTNNSDWNVNPNWDSVKPGWDDDAFVVGSGTLQGVAVVTSPGASAFRLFIGGNPLGPGLPDYVGVDSLVSLKVTDTIQIGHENDGVLEVNGIVEATNVILGNGSLLGGATHSGTLILNPGSTLKASVIAKAGGSGTFLINNATLFTTPGGNYSAAAHVGSLGLNFFSDQTSNISTFSGALSGPGAVGKFGLGVVNLTGANTFTGGIWLAGGALGASSDSNLGGPASTIAFQGGLLRVNGTSLTNIDAHAVNWSTFNGGIDVAVSTHTFNVNSNISGSGSLTKEGAGILHLNGTNTHTGGTILRAGKVAITTSSNIGGAGSSISFQGGSLRILGTSLANLDAHNVNWSSFNGGFDIASSSHTFVINQVLGGSGGLIKDGPGTLVLNAANTFTGNTIINAGVLKLGHPQAIQFSTLNFPGSGGTLDLNGFNLSIGGIAGGGGFDLKGGTLTVGANNLSTVFSGVISDSVGGGRLVKVGSGNLTLSGNSPTALIIVAKQGGIGFESNVSASGSSPFGTSNAGVLLDGGKLVRTSSAGAAWDRLFTIGPGGGTIEGSTGYAKFNSTGTVPFSATGNTTLTISGSQADNEFKFKLVETTGGVLTVNKVGSGRWIISPATAMTYSGDTNISAGTWILNGGSNLMPFGAGKGNVNVSSGAQFELNGRSVSINALIGGGNVNNRTGTQSLTLGNGDASGTFSGTMTGGINLIKVGSGVQVLTGSNTYTGATTVNAGVLRFNSTGAIGGTGSTVMVNTGAAAAAGFAMTQTFLSRLNPGSGGAAALAANSSNALSFAGFASLSLGAVGSAMYSGTLTPDGTTYRLGGGGGSLIFSNTNALTGARSLQVVGPGVVKFNNPQNYTGGTTVNGGALVVPNLRNGALTVNGGAVQISAKAQANDVNGTSVVLALTIDSSDAKLDLTNNAMVIDYTGGSPVQSVRQLLRSGVTTSFGIVSTSADLTKRIGYIDNSVSGLAVFSGQSVDPTSVLLKFSYAGDADLDGDVDVADLGALATAWQSSAVWSGGDFDYNGTVDVNDLGMLATDWQAGVGSPLASKPTAGPWAFDDALASFGLPIASVPEPTLLTIGAAVTFGNAVRARRRLNRP